MAWAHAQEAFNSQERILEGLMFHLDLKGAKEKAGRGAVRGEIMLFEQRGQPVRRQESMEEDAIL